jgi:hypothetical protein
MKGVTKLAALFLTVLLFAGTNVALADSQTITYQPNATTGNDTYIVSGSPNNNFGADTTMDIRGDDARRTLLKFSLPDVPSNAIVTSAVLTLFVTAKGSGDPAVNVYRSNNSWDEGTGAGSVTGDGATWNNRTGSSAWGSSGGDFDSSMLWANVTVTAINRFFDWNMTGLVQAWVNGTYTNQGILIRSTTVGSATTSFASSDNTNSTRRPQLAINYTVPPAWSNQAQNNTAPPTGAAVNLSTRWTDNSTLAYAWLSTNETGAWRNKTSYDSPRLLNTSAALVNFTWQNASVTVNTTVGWRIYANNSLGLTNATATMTFIVSDNNAPTITLSQPDGAAIAQSNMVFNFTVTDDYSPATNCTIRIDNAVRGTNNSVFNNTLTSLAVTGIADGFHLWNVTCTDGFGNPGHSNRLNFTVDTTSPSISNISWSPSSADQLDPNVTVTVTTNVTDATVGTDMVLLQYKQTNASVWQSINMTSIGGNLFSGNFTPDVANNWTFGIVANDTLNNTNTGNETTLDISLDGSWNVNPAIFGGVSGAINSNVSVGNLIINNTADYDHTFSISSNFANTFFNVTTIAIPAGGIGVIAVTATASSTVREDDVMLTISTTNSTAAQSSLTSNFTLVSFVSGPYLYVTVDDAPASMVQGDSNNFTVSVKNLGNATATDAWLSWSLPAGWSITSASTNTSLSNIIVGDIGSDTFVITVSSSAATGLNTLTALVGSAETTGNKSVAVVVTAPSTTTTNTETITTGGGAAGGAPAPAPTLSATAPANAAVQIGTEEGFPVKVTNNFDDNLANIRLEVSGFLSQYLSIEPTAIALLKPGEVGQFIVKIKAPDYLSDQNFQLNITVRADRVTARGTTELTKSLTTGLLLLAVAPEQVSNSLPGAEQAIKDAEAAGLNAQKLQQLLDDAKSALAAKNYADADRLMKEIMRLKDVALGATAQMKTMEEKIMAVHAEGLSIPETERVVQLAKEAMTRGDFDRAAARLGSASLTLALETKGQVNVIALSIHWWWLIALGSLVTAMGAATAWRELTLWRIGRGLSNMRREERSINELMGQTQAAYYHGQSIPKVDFYKTMYGYEKRLAEVHADFSRLVTQRAKLINATDEVKRLDSEDAKLKRLIIELQKKYFEEGRMGKAAYERQMHELVKRRSELAEQHELVMKQERQKISRVARLAERTKGLYNRAAAAADRWVRGI